MKIIAHEDDYELISALLNSYYQDELTLGQMLKILRKDLLEMTQADYAKLVGISRRSLSDLEQDRSHSTAHILNAVFTPFGLKTGLVPANQVMEVYATLNK
ncbi:helix-turn-helix domain-containing protein [Lacimicrobium sp. SS2-24]|uniref:helix-turn-helix transcriptional regulator n=1 Tax=Lacimicrobium sp. SS2-24 TaxID=2005569 RepID=UPI001AEF4C45|nr:helix-turn-helix domain-containing protein [Lacimicrobium sp. SS2-24]